MHCRKLLSEYELSNNIPLANRLVMAPMIRRAVASGGVVTKKIVNYYANRASAGLIISEATMISKWARSYTKVAGIYSIRQIEAWKLVTEEVHRRNGKIFLQLWHPGRLSNRIRLNGEMPLGPSSLRAEGTLGWSKLKFDTPKEMSEDDIEEVVCDFANAAKNAIEAGFDGVEIHGANGYLLEQFLRRAANQRKDMYGRSIIFPLKVIDAVISAVGAGRVGIRLSMTSFPFLELHSEDIESYTHLLHELNKRKIAYVHVASSDDREKISGLNTTVTQFFRELYKGTIIGSGSYSLLRAEKAIQDGLCDLVSFGRLFISNPDLVYRAEMGKEEKAFEENMLSSL